MGSTQRWPGLWVQAAGTRCLVQSIPVRSHLFQALGIFSQAGLTPWDGQGLWSSQEQPGPSSAWPSSARSCLCNGLPGHLGTSCANASTSILHLFCPPGGPQAAACSSAVLLNPGLIPPEEQAGITHLPRGLWGWTHSGAKSSGDRAKLCPDSW